MAAPFPRSVFTFSKLFEVVASMSFSPRSFNFSADMDLSILTLIRNVSFEKVY
jgi:hypothetical protein